MGIRTPGEKTAYEVQTLEAAASRIFQNKIVQFERTCLEDILNKMFEVARRNMDGVDLIRTIDDDLGVVGFMEITKEDITASGQFVPVGARHFAAQATLVQNITNFYASPVGQDPAVKAHLSGKRIAKLFEEFLGIDEFELVRDNIRISEETETASMAQEAHMQLQEREMTPTEPELPPEVEAAMKG
jgi:hypothetical protein